MLWLTRGACVGHSCVHWAAEAEIGGARRGHLSAIWIRRCGRKVPSVSMYIALPSPPPMSMGSWHVTHSV